MNEMFLKMIEKRKIKIMAVISRELPSFCFQSNGNRKRRRSWWHARQAWQNCTGLVKF